MPLGRLRDICEDNINIDLEMYGLDWVHLDEDRIQLRALMDTIMSILIPQTAANLLPS
jgi:hypothetical protein